MTRDLVRLIRLLRPFWGRMSLAAILALATSLANVALLATSGWFITAMGLAGLAAVSINYFTPAAMIRAFAIVRTGGRYAERIVGHDATLRIISGLRIWLLQCLVPLVPAGLGGERSADLLTRLRGDVERLDQVFLRFLLPAAVAVLGIVVCILALAFVHAATAAAGLVLLVLSAIALPAVLLKMSIPIGEHLADSGSALNSALTDTIDGMADLMAHGALTDAEATIHERSSGVIQANSRIALLGALGSAGVTLASNLALLAALLLAVPAFTSGVMSGAQLVMLTFLAWATFEVVSPLPLAMLSLGAAGGSARRVFAIADRKPPISDILVDAEAKPHDGSLRFLQVSFTYTDHHAPALRAIDLEIQPGRHVGIIGPSGSGKSTLAALAMRLIEPDIGTVELGRVDLRRMPEQIIRDSIALAAQNAHIFTGTIAENLAIARPAVEQSDIEQACRLAHLHNFIASQPAGYDTFVGGAGLGLSGGQSKRLAIARTLIRNAPVLILDEPAEGLDDATGDAMLRDIRSAYRSRAMLVISHRFAGLEDFDELIFLDKGRVVERGEPRRVLTALAERFPK